LETCESILKYRRAALFDWPQVEIDSVEDPGIKQKIRELIKACRPQKPKETKVKMNIALKDEIPVYQRELAERVEVNNRIDNQLHDGIIKASVSE